MHSLKAVMRAAIGLSLAVLCSSSLLAYMNDENGMGPGKQAGPHSKINRLALQRFASEIAPKDPVLSHYDFFPTAKAYGLDVANASPFEVESDACVVAGDWYKDQSVPGLSKLPFTAKCTYQDGRVKQPFAWWIYEGGYGADEPEWYMSLRHFYDPAHKSRNADGQLVSYLTDDLNGYLAPFFMGYNPAMNAKQWALDDSPYSLKQCDESLGRAFGTAPSLPAKQLHFGAAWRGIGESMHLLADMTVPAHVRNDSHPDKAGRWSEDLVNLKGDAYEKYVTAKVVYEWAKDGYYDEGLAKKISAANDADQLFDLVAKYTNSSFFSLDTISGVDAVTREQVNSFNAQPNYDSPKLDGYKFTEGDKNDGSGFYSDKYGTDVAYRRSDGKYSLEPVVSTQAKRLIPIAIMANAKLIDLCVPRIGVSLGGIDPMSKTLKCTVYDYTADAGRYSKSKSTKHPSCWDSVLLFAGTQGSSQASAAATSSEPASQQNDGDKSLGKAVKDLKKSVDDLVSIFGKRKKKDKASENEPIATQPSSDTAGMHAYWTPVAKSDAGSFDVTLPKETVDQVGTMLSDEKTTTSSGIRLITGVDMGGILVKSKPFTVYSVNVTLPEPQPENGFDCKCTVAGSNLAQGLRYEWDFGDGTPVEKTDNPESTHHYAKGGKFMANARIVDTTSGDLFGQALAKIALKETEAESPSPEPQAKPQTVSVGKRDKRTLEQVVLDDFLIGFEGNSTPEILARMTSRSRYGFSYLQGAEAKYGEDWDDQKTGWCKTIVAKGVIHRLEDEDGVYNDKVTRLVEYPYIAWYQISPLGCDFYRSPYSAYGSLGELNAEPDSDGLYATAQAKLDKITSSQSGGSKSVGIGDRGAVGVDWCAAIRGPMYMGAQVHAEVAFYRPKNNTQQGSWHSFSSPGGLKLSVSNASYPDGAALVASFEKWTAESGNLAAEVVAGQMSAWDAWYGSKVSTGDGMRGYYTPNAWRYAIVPTDIGEGFELGKSESRKPWDKENKSGFNTNYYRYSSGPGGYAERYMVGVHIEDMYSGRPMFENSVAQYNSLLKSMKRPAVVSIPGVDASSQMVWREGSENKQRVIFRKGNVWVEITGYHQGQKKQAPAPKAERVAGLIAAKLNSARK